MKVSLSVTSVMAVQFMAANSSCANLPVREHLLTDYNWKFIHGDAIGAQEPSFDDSGWKNVTLPYDWSIGGGSAKIRPQAEPEAAGSLCSRTRRGLS